MSAAQALPIGESLQPNGREIVLPGRTGRRPLHPVADFDPGADQLASMRLDWDHLRGQDLQGSDWLIEPLIARSRVHSLVGPPKQGKSLVLLDIVARAATGKAVLHHPAGRPVRTLYIDYEMTEGDIQDRMLSMNLLDERDIPLLQDNLAYILFPGVGLPPLNTREGGDTLCSLARAHRADLVVLDTFQRAFDGDENDSQSVRGFFQHTGAPLKRAGIALIRADHVGHQNQGRARGSSAKADDIDIGWVLKPTPGGCTLRAEHRRVGWVPEEIHLTQTEDPLGYEIGARTWPTGTAELASELDDLRLALDASEADAQAALKQRNGQGRRGIVVRAALRYRRAEWPQL